jgi:anti-anti-sigma factor
MSGLLLNQDELNKLIQTLPQAAEPEKQLFQTRIIKDHILLISIQGRILGQDDSLAFINQFTSSFSGKSVPLIIDLTECTYLSSIVLGALARLSEEHIKNHKKIAAFGANEVISDLLQLTQFTDFIELYDTLEQAETHHTDSKNHFKST